MGGRPQASGEQTPSKRASPARAVRRPSYLPEHINKLGLRSALTAVRRRLRVASAVGSRFIHLDDSQVAIGARVKARSFSYDLAPVIDEYNAIILAGGLRPILAYAHAELNPADKPSRVRLWRESRLSRSFG